jgi:transcriptional regulator with XRE-family HTH domain
LTYGDAQAKLLANVRDRIHNGELTERGLARLIGISQPHVHNVLKGVRKFSPEILDSILEHFQMSLLDVAPMEEMEASLLRRRTLELRGERTAERTAEAAFLARPIGPGAEWPASIDWRRRFPLPFPSLEVRPELVMASLIPDPAMAASLAGADIALLDTSGRSRREIVAQGLYVVSRRNQALLRYIRPGTRGHYLATDWNLDHPAQWEPVAVPAEEFLRTVKARVLWAGRESDRKLPMRQRGRFWNEAISR